MFVGIYTHNLDSKGRLTIPVRYRNLLKDGVYITQGYGPYLMVQPISVFQQIAKHISQMSITDPDARQLRRLIFATADQTELDGSGRIRIPQHIKENVDLENEVMIVSGGEYLELWSPEHWALQEAELRDTDAIEKKFSEYQVAVGQ